MNQAMDAPLCVQPIEYVLRAVSREIIHADDFFPNRHCMHLVRE